MNEEPPVQCVQPVQTMQPVQRVEVSFVGAAPVHRIRRAAGVSDVEAHGAVLRCLVSGSFQPFLEALRGYGVVSLTSSPAKVGPAGPARC